MRCDDEPPWARAAGWPALAAKLLPGAWWLLKSSLFVMLPSSCSSIPPCADAPSAFLFPNIYLVQPVFHLMKLMTQVRRIEAPWSIDKRWIGVSCLWLLFRILSTRLTSTGLIWVGSISINSSLNVIEFISSLAMVQFGATHPLSMQTILSTFSTKGWGLTYFLKLMICCFVNYLIETSVILMAYWNSYSVNSTSNSSPVPSSSWFWYFMPMNFPSFAFGWPARPSCLVT